MLDETGLGAYLADCRTASELVSAVERAVADGVLAPGQALPPVRAMARDLGVNPATVGSAYRQLRERAVVETGGRRGTRVRPRPATAPREALTLEPPPGAVDLSTGNPDPALLPDLTAAMAQAARRHARTPALYGGPAAAPRLAELAAARLAADGVPSGPLAVVAGALDGIDGVLSSAVRPGDAVAVEDPGWHVVLDLLALLGARPLPVRVDDEGPLPEDVAAALAAGARALIVTSRAHNPTGAALSAARAEHLRAVLAARPDLLVIDDDHCAEIAGAPPHYLSGSTDRWALVRSAAKTYGPDLRVAVLTGDPDTLDRVQGRRRLGYGWVSHLLQHTLAHLWETDAVDTAAVTRRYDERRTALLHALAAHGVPAHGRSGMNVWVPVAEEAPVASRLLNRGWVVALGARFRLGSPPGLRVTTAALDPGRAPELAADIAQASRLHVSGRST